jgi:arylsulfatase A-like enzyme
MRKPNIIFMLADDLGYADLACYGQEKIRTPSIDRMAFEGVRFSDCYAGSPVCAPCRSVLMTGQHTGHTRVRENFARVGGTPPQGRAPLEPEDVTVAEVLKEAGYATGITGKWGLGEPDTTGIPNRQGFDEWFGYLNQRRAHSYYPDYLWHNEEKVILEGNLEGKRGQYSHDMITEFGLDFIRRHHAKPFFLYFAWTLPHDRLEPPSLEPYADTDWPEEAKAYAAMVSRMDRDVGRVLDMLRELGIDERTIVFFTSDNGAARRWEGMFDSSGPLRGHKSEVYEGGIRVPMVVRHPGKVPAGKTSYSPWYFADFLPTAAEIAGVDPPDKIDGVSVLRSLHGGKQVLEDRKMYWEFPGQKFCRAVRWNHWKAVRLGQDSLVELYDLSKDVGEQNNVAGEHPDVVADMEAFMKASHVDSPYWPLDG